MMAENGKVRQAKISELTPDRRNANKGTQAGLRALDKSLRELGAGRSILIDKDGEIIAGNKTTERAADLGLEDVIIVQTDGTKLVAVQRTDLDLDTDEEARQLAYADNRIAELDLDWDYEQVDFDLEQGIDLEWLGFEVEQEPADDPGAQIDRAEELREKWGVESGQLWRLGEHRLICGDCTDAEIINRLEIEQKASVIADPPYGINLDTDYSKIKGTDKSPNAKGYEYEAIEGDDKPFDFMPFAGWSYKEQFWFGADYYARQLPIDGSWFVWIKRNEADAEMIGNDFELFWSKRKHKRRALRIRWVGWGATERTETRIHPTQKPVELIEWIIEKYVDGVVYDPFLGSGTTLIACERLNRKCRAVEISPAYCAVAIQRWVDMTGSEPELIDS